MQIYIILGFWSRVINSANNNLDEDKKDEENDSEDKESACEDGEIEIREINTPVTLNSSVLFPATRTIRKSRSGRRNTTIKCYWW